MLLSNQPVVDKANQFSTKKEIIFILFSFRDIKLGVNSLDTCGSETYALNQSLEFIKSSLNTFDASQ